MADSNSIKHGNRFIDITGQVFGKWTVMLEFHLRAKDGHVLWLCRCECGKEKPISGRNLRTGRSRSCFSCLRTKHGKIDTPEYSIWSTMRFRCSNPSAIGYAYWGGRGITVCERWQSFEKFLEDMGTRPSSSHSIERKNNDGNYEKSNCYWATRKEQARNTRTNRMLAFSGKIACVVEWAEETGIHPNTLRKRLKLGWSTEKALTTPVKVKRES